VRPRPFAVFAFTTSSNFVGRSWDSRTRRNNLSVGLAPVERQMGRLRNRGPGFAFYFFDLLPYRHIRWSDC
jgi:hypothetical protein